MVENKNPLEQIATLLKVTSRKSFEIAETNFRVGQIVSNVCATEGESAISKLAAMLNKEGVKISMDFLFEAYRVFRAIKSEGTLNMIKQRLHGNLRWGFLVYHCTKAPEGDTEEANLFWEKKIKQIETALEDTDALYAAIDSLPPRIREQVVGLLHGTGQNISISPEGPREVMEGPYVVGHMADMQVDDSFTVAGKLVIDSKTGMNERLLDIHKCISFAADKMIQGGCRACLIPGDPTETHNPSPNVQRYLLQSLSKIAKHMPVFIEPGNHGLSKNPKDSTALEFLKGRENIHVVEEPAVFYQEGLSVNNAPSETWPQKDCAKIFVLPFPSRAIANGDTHSKSIAELNTIVSDKLRMILHMFRAEIDPRVPNILLAHITVRQSVNDEKKEMLKFDPTLDIEDLDGFDYVALGHLHKYEEVAPNRFYSGSIDRMDFNEEGQKKGFIIVSFDGRIPRPEFIETPAREFQTLSPEFFSSLNWQDLVDPRTIYRIKGDVEKEEYEALKPALNSFPQPLLNKLVVKRDIRFKDEHMTEDLNEDDALRRYLSVQGIDEDTINACLLEHLNIISTGKKEEAVIYDTPLFEAA